MKILYYSRKYLLDMTDLYLTIADVIAKKDRDEQVQILEPWRWRNTFLTKYYSTIESRFDAKFSAWSWTFMKISRKCVLSILECCLRMLNCKFSKASSSFSHYPYQSYYMWFMTMYSRTITKKWREIFYICLQEFKVRSFPIKWWQYLSRIVWSILLI